MKMETFRGFVMEITKERWESLIQKTKHVHNYSKECGADIEDYEIDLILSVLKNNVPFEVVESTRKQIKDRNDGK